MPKVDHVASLISYIGRKDFKSARKIIEVMISNERDNGREMAAVRLESALRNWGHNNEKLVELPTNLKPLLFDSVNQMDLEDIYLDLSIKSEIVRFLKERDKLDELRKAGLPMRNRILLAGPPGNGKTSLAGAVSKKLSLPFYAVKMSEIIDSALGEMGKNIAKVIDYAFSSNCVLFLDELDTLGSQRVSSGEGCDRAYNNTLNVILTNLDKLPDTSIIIGATNMPETLDTALLRRFNLKLWLDTPHDRDILKYVLAYQCDHNIRFFISEDEIVSCLSGQPWSKIEEFCLNQHRAIVLNEEIDMNSQSLWVGKAV